MPRTSRRTRSPSAAPDGAIRLVALLRAINVGSHIVKMQALRDHFTALGLSRVETFIASGNVLFDGTGEDPARLESRIEAHLRVALGYDVATFLRRPAELQAVAIRDAFPGSGAGEPGYPLYIAFTRTAVRPEAERALIALRNDVDDFMVDGREVYWSCHTSLSQSTFTGARLEKIIGMPATLRNVTTVRKLAALVNPVL